jgi:DNA-directed RNA polymerase subunit RPC12/RpoP
MMAATFACNTCKMKFQVIGISTRDDARYCPYCGGGSIQHDNIILC